jgi:hypothetical protein
MARCSHVRYNQRMSLLFHHSVIKWLRGWTPHVMGSVLPTTNIFHCVETYITNRYNEKR